MKRSTFEGISPKKFRRKVGVKRRTFVAIFKRVKASIAEERTQQPLHGRGKKSTALPLVDKLLLTCMYLRQYPTFAELGDLFGISESYANKLSHRHLDILVRVLRLPGKKALPEQRIEAILSDVTEQPMERPVKKQRQWYSGKKKGHTIKAQWIVCAETLQILRVVCGKGRTHDFKLLKRCRLKLLKEIKKYGESGYQGIQKLYPNSQTPHKTSNHHALTQDEKRENRALAKLRIPIEHVNRRCKIFRAVKETYRGKHAHYHKIWTVVAALVNLRYASETP